MADRGETKGLIKIIQYCINKLKLFIKHGVTPIMVFDGGKLISKNGVENDRGKRRAEAMKQIKYYLDKGKP